MYAGSPATTVGSLLAAAGLAVAMYGQVPAVILAVWLIAMILHQARRVYHYRGYLRAQPNADQIEPWGRRYVAAAIAAGVLWGAAGYFMYVPDAPYRQALLYLVLFGVCAVSVIGLSAYARAFFPLVILTLTPGIVRLLMEWDSQALFLALVAAVVLGTSLFFGRNMNRLIADSLRMRFENVDLIDELTHQREIADRARHAAETANRSKTQFFAAASHDLRQPLHALGLFAAALRRKLAGSEAETLVTNIGDSVEALENQFTALLDISKLDSGVIQPNAVDFSVAGTFDRVRTDFEVAAHDAGLELKIVATGCIARSDPVLVERILRNLVSNAIRYTKKGAVLVGCRRHDGGLRLEVWDTGIGIPEPEQNRIFEEFYQVANPERDRSKGLGLGLATVQRLAQLLGTEVTVSSVPGRGSVFRFELPRGAAPQVVPEPAARDPDAKPDGLSGRRVIVIDDEAPIRDGMVAVLSLWGCRTVAAGSIDEALDRLPELDGYPDIVIADYRLREAETGIGAVRRLRYELGIDVPAIVVTGTAAPDSLHDIHESGLPTLYKPVTAETLYDALVTLVKRPSSP